MKTRTFTLTDCFDRKVSIKVRKPSLVEKIKYQNSIQNKKNEIERIEEMVKAGLLITEKIVEAPKGFTKNDLEKEFDDALVHVAFLMYKDSTVEDYKSGDKSGVEPNFSKKK